MAITHVASVPTTAATQTATTSLALVIPAGTLANDILVIDASTQDAGGVTCTDNDTGGNTWTTKEVRANGTHSLTLLWKRATSGTASKTATIAGGTINICGAIAVYRGCVTTGDPIEALLSEANASGNNTQAQITTLTAGAMVCLTASIADDRTYTIGSGDCTDPATLTARSSVINAAGATDNSLFHASNTKATAGGTGAFVWTWAANALGASRAYALKPAASGPTIVEADGNSTGTATPTGVSGKTAGSDGAVAGLAASSVLGAAIRTSTASAAGVSTQSGAGVTVLASVAAASGTGVALGDGEEVAGGGGTIVEADAAAAGSATATAQASAMWASGASASGVGTASGIGAARWASVGSVAGVTTVTATAAAFRASVGTAAGSGVALAEGENGAAGSIIEAEGHSAGEAEMLGMAAVILAGRGVSESGGGGYQLIIND